MREIRRDKLKAMFSSKEEIFSDHQVIDAHRNTQTSTDLFMEHKGRLFFSLDRQ